MSTTYEWDVEELTEAPSEANGFDPDIHDHHHCGSYSEAKATLSELGVPGRIVLVRDVGSDREGLTDRAWAYLEEDGSLPETFTYGADEDSGILVPRKFHAEVRI